MIQSQIWMDLLVEYCFNYLYLHSMRKLYLLLVEAIVYFL